MAKQANQIPNQLQKVIAFTLGLIFLYTTAIAQIKKEDTKALIQRSPLNDSIARRLKTIGVPFNRIFLSPIKNINSRIVTDLITNMRGELTGKVDNILKNPIELYNAEISFQEMADTSYLYGGQQYFRNNFDLTSDWSVAGIPLSANLQRQSWSDFNNKDLFQYSFHFDRENYLSQLKKRLTGKFDPSALMNSFKNPIETVIAEARKSLTNDLEELSKNYKGLLDNEVGQIKNMENLFTTDINSLKEKFLNQGYIKEVIQKEKLLTALQQRKNNGEKLNEDEFNDLQNAVIKMKGVQDLLNKIEQHKNKWEQSGLLKKIKEFDLFKKINVSRLLNDPSIITKLARQNLSLSGLQRLFLNITHLNIGQNTLSLSPLSLQHFNSKGISTEFESKSRSFTFVGGRQTDFNSIQDYPFSNSAFSNEGIAKMFQVGTGIGTRSTTNVSVSSFSQSMPGLINQGIASAIRQVLVTTISNQISVGEKGLVNFELSRSATQYNRTGSAADSTIMGKSNLSRVFSGENFAGNTAISLKYSDEFTDQGLLYNVSFSKIANGYTNPGNSYLPTGSTEFGMGVRKSFLKNKILLSFKENARVYKYNDKLDASWRNSNLWLDVKWKMKKGQYIAFRYQPVRMSRIESRHKTPVSSFDRLSAEANVYKKFGKIVYSNFFSLSGQKNMYMIQPNQIINNNSLTVNSFQHILIGKKIMYVNANYTYANNTTQYIFLNSSFYTEAGYTYQLYKNITASSGFVYNSIDGWYKQVGIRQTISGQLGNRFNVNAYVDIKKNIKVIQPLWDGPVRANIDLRYILKNKH